MMQSLGLPSIAELDEDTRSNIQQTYDTRINRGKQFIQGGPVFHTSNKLENGKISDLNQFSKDYEIHKATFKSKLQRNWQEALELTQPYKFDKNLNFPAS